MTCVKRVAGLWHTRRPILLANRGFAAIERFMPGIAVIGATCCGQKSLPRDCRAGLITNKVGIA